MINYYELFGLADPYDRFRGKKVLHPRVKGWTGTLPFFETAISEINPKLIIEIGSFLGESAINMGKISKRLGLDIQIICIDTWLGSDEHWRDDKCGMMHFFDHFKNGISSMYDQFVKNVLFNGVDDIIVPIPNTSTTGYNILKWKNVTADLIYVDGSHDKDDVKKDIRMFWELLNSKGMMFGDDYNSWQSVKEAANEMSVEMNIPLIVRDDHFWTMKKV